VKRLISILFIVFVQSLMTGAHAQDRAPTENQRLSLSRTGASNVVSGVLSKNIFRYEDRVVSVPYQVPYTETVPYIDIEYYDRAVQRCGTVPVQQCRSVPRCRSEPVCSNIPGVCRNVSDQVCRRDAQGRQTCTQITRRDCEPARNVCRSENRCRNESVCRTVFENRCRLDYVRESRPVTRYRSETRYRTEYRNETQSVPVFVRQWNVPVSVMFPVNAELIQDESELIQLVLSGDELNPIVDVSVESAIYSYKVFSNQRIGEETQITLATVAKYFSSDLGASSLVNLRMIADLKKSAALISFKDNGRKPRVRSVYHISIQDLETRKTVFEASLEKGPGLGEIEIPVSTPLNLQSDFKVSLQVSRQGSVIEGGAVQFQQTQTARALVDQAVYSDPSMLKNLSVSGVLADVMIRFEDATPLHSKVKTEYQVTIKRRTHFLFIATGWEAIGSGVVVDHAVRVSQLGVSQDDIADYLEEGDRILVEVKAIHTSDRFAYDRPIEVTQERIVDLGE